MARVSIFADFRVWTPTAARLATGLMVGTFLTTTVALAAVVTSGTTSPTINTTGDYSTSSSVTAGRNADGALTVSGGSVATANRVYGGYSTSVTVPATLTGTIAVTGSGSTLRTTGDDNRVYVGYGTGVVGLVTVDNGGLIDTRYLNIGQFGTGTVTVTGSGSSIRATTQYGLSTGSNSYEAGYIDLGRDGGSGTLKVLNGATVYIGPGDTANTTTVTPVLAIGLDAGSSGAVTIDGAGSAISLVQTGRANWSAGQYGAQVGVGVSGTGTMMVSGGGSLSLDGGLDPAYVQVGARVGSTGTLNVTGTGSKVTVTGGAPSSDGSHTGFTVGRYGTGYLNVSAGGVVALASSDQPLFRIGQYEGSSGTVVVDGVGSSITVTQTATSLTGEDAGASLGVGYFGTGSLTIKNGASVSVDGGVNLANVNVGQRSGSSGSLVVTGAGSRLSVAGGSPVVTSIDENGIAASSNSGIIVGRSSNGTMEVSDGGAVSLTTTVGGVFAIGYDAGVTGSVLVTGKGSSITFTQTEVPSASNSGYAAHMRVSKYGTGYLTIAAGGAVTLDGGPSQAYANIGDKTADATGTVVVDGAGSIWTVKGAYSSYSPIGALINVGTYGTGSLTVSNGGSVVVSGTTGTGDINIGLNTGSTGTMTISGSGSTVAVSGSNSTGSADFATGVFVGVSGNGTLNVLNGGELTIDGSGDAYSGLYVGNSSGSTGSVLISGAGSTINAGKRVVIGLTNALTAGGTGTVEVGSGGSLIAENVYVGPSGTLRGVGSVTGTVVNRGGVVAPGGSSSVGTMTINGDYTQTSGTLAIRAAGANSVSALNVTGNATITGGTEAFTFVDGYTPAAGDRLRYIVAGGTVTESGVTRVYSGLSTDYLKAQDITLVAGDGTLRFLSNAVVQKEAAQTASAGQMRSTVANLGQTLSGRIGALTASAGGAGFRQPTRSSGISGIAGGDEASMSVDVGVWADGAYSRQERSAPNEKYGSNIYMAIVGVDVILGGNWVVGAAIAHDRADTNLISAVGGASARGVSGNLYVGRAFTPNLSANVVAGYGWSDNSIHSSLLGSRVSGDYGARRMTTAAGLQASAEYEGIRFTGNLGVRYSYQWADAYTASNGRRVQPGDTWLGQLHTDAEISYPVADWVTAFGSLGVDHDFIASPASTDSTLSESRLGMTAGGGLRFNLGDRFSAAISANREFLRDWQEGYTVDASVRWKF